MSEKKAIVFLAEGFEEIEAITPIDYLRRAGVEVTTVAIGKGSRAVTGAHGIVVNADINLDSYLSSGAASLPDAVVVPGGMPGASNIAGCHTAVSLIQEAFDAGRLVCAICASPAVVLSHTTVLKGRRWTCYPSMESSAPDYVATHEEGKAFVADGNLITGRGPGAAEQFAMEIVRTMCGDKVYETIKAGSCQR